MTERHTDTQQSADPLGQGLQDGGSESFEALDGPVEADRNISGETSISTGRNPLDDRYSHGGYLAENNDWHEARAEWKAEQVAQMLSKHRLEPRTICDIGCGTGGVLDALRTLMPNSPTLTGYEVAGQAISLASAERRDRIELIQGSHDIDDRRFDVLLALDVFEHLEDYYGFLRGIRAKAPLAIFHIPIDTAVTTVLRPGPVLRSYRKVGHIQHYTPTLALEALRHAGYKIVDYQHTVPARVATPTSIRGRIGKAARLTLAHVNLELAGRLVTGFPLLVLAETGTAAK